MVKNFYVTTYCNQAHSLKTGAPIGHECYRLPPAALEAEREGNFDKALEILKSMHPVHRRAILRGTK